MAKFPDKESDILMLAQSMVVGLETYTTDYPTPPVNSAALDLKMQAYITAKDAASAADGLAQTATQGKNAALASLVDDMKKDLHYAEDTVHFDAGKLKLIGWDGHTAGSALTPPGEPRALEAPRQGEGWIFLDWKSPADGGAVATYKVQRRLRPDGPWNDIGLSLESEIMLLTQERAKEWEYRITAVNKAGESAPSNTVMAVL